VEKVRPHVVEGGIYIPYAKGKVLPSYDQAEKNFNCPYFKKVRSASCTLPKGTKETALSPP